MAEEVITTPPVATTVDEREVAARPRVGAPVVDERGLGARPRVSWGAIFGGAFAALGLWLLLYAFGMAIGLSTIDPNNPHSVKGSGIFTGVWSAVSPLLALFIGGLVAGRLAGVFNRGSGALHGLIMWGLVGVAGSLLVASFVSTAVAGAAVAGKMAVEGGGAALKGIASGGAGAAEQLGLNWNDMLGPINQRLEAQGKPPVRADQLKAATREAVQGALRTGHFDRNLFESSLAQNTALSRQDVQDISQQVESRVSEVTGGLKERAQGAVAAARTGALKVADTTGKAFWGVFGALLLGLIAALAGGAVGVPRLRALERVERGPRTVTTVEPPPRGPILPPREAYPRT